MMIPLSLRNRAFNAAIRVNKHTTYMEKDLQDELTDILKAVVLCADYSVLKGQFVPFTPLTVSPVVPPEVVNENTVKTYADSKEEKPFDPNTVLWTPGKDIQTKNPTPDEIKLQQGLADWKGNNLVVVQGEDLPEVRITN